MSCRVSGYDEQEQNMRRAQDLQGSGDQEQEQEQKMKRAHVLQGIRRSGAESR